MIRLLSDIERERLIHRSQDAKTRASNDVRIRKKLRSWLKSLDDIELICEYLPEDQIIKEITDNHVYFLLAIAKGFMKNLKFAPIVGKVDQPDDWKIQLTVGPGYPANDIDINRSLSLIKSVEDLMAFHGKDNPIETILHLSRLDSRPELRNKITEGERRGLERLIRAVEGNYDPRIIKMSFERDKS